MNLPFFIAKRYLVSRKKTNIVNVISGISIVGVSIGTAALIVVLSVMNGFDSLVKSLFSTFDSDFRITAVEGKSFSPDQDVFERVRGMPEVVHFAEVVEDNALLRYGERQSPAIIKGVDREFELMTGIDSMIVEGEFILSRQGLNFAVVGRELAYYLGVGVKFVNPMYVYTPRKGRRMGMSIEANFNSRHIYPAGIFSIQQELDSKYIIVPLRFAREMFELPDNVTAVELMVDKGASVNRVQGEIASVLGSGYEVKNRYQQKEYIYKILKSEKWAVYLILIFILVIASFNVVGSLTMLILDKRKDISILRSMGATRVLIRKIFLFEGWSVSFLGAFAGTVFGVLISYLQQSYGLLKLNGGGGSFAVPAYPVQVVPEDIAIVFVSVVVIGFFAAWFPVRYISSRYLVEDMH